MKTPLFSFEKSLTVINSMLTFGLVLFGAIQVYDNNKLVNVTNLKYEQENRPYVYIESLDWVDKFPTLFSVAIKNPGNFPAKTKLEVVITDNEDREVMVKNIDEFILFPFYKTARVSVNQGFSLTLKDDDSKEVVFSSKDSEKLKYLLGSGKIIRINISANYSSLVDTQPSKKYHYSQEFLLKKEDGSIIIKPSKIDAN